jgi:hypothetical protein
MEHGFEVSKTPRAVPLLQTGEPPGYFECGPFAATDIGFVESPFREMRARPAVVRRDQVQRNVPLLRREVHWKLIAGIQQRPQFVAITVEAAPVQMLALSQQGAAVPISCRALPDLSALTQIVTFAGPLENAARALVDAELPRKVGRYRPDFCLMLVKPLG